MTTLTELFGEGNNAYFSNGSVTRLSFLRGDHKQLDQASTHPSAKYLTFENLNPLAAKEDGEFVYLGYNDVKQLIGRPYSKDEKTLLNEFDPTAHPPTLIFLGLDLVRGGLGAQLDRYSGRPYFALDVTSDAYADFKKKQAEQGNEYTDRRIDLKLPQDESAILSHARSLLDWNKRNLFCSSCGGKTMSTNGGAKVICPPSTGRACSTRVGLHNQAFPRTDPTVIAAPISADAKRILLGRNKRWPPNYWSCLSGFVEPGESIEQAVRRETYEESGVMLDRVQIHSSQPWPFPSSLLIGAMGQCISGCENITYPETELEEARWYEMGEVEHALDYGANAMWEPPIKGYSGPRVPPKQLMAHQLLRGVLRLFHK